MNIVTKHLDFWLGDFKWYRNLTEDYKTEWICKHEKTFYNGNSSSWQRFPRGTFFMINIVKQLKYDYPNIENLNEAEKREIIQKYIDMNYNQN